MGVERIERGPRRFETGAGRLRARGTFGRGSDREGNAAAHPRAMVRAVMVAACQRDKLGGREKGRRVALLADDEEEADDNR